MVADVIKWTINKDKNFEETFQHETDINIHKDSLNIKDGWVGDTWYILRLQLQEYGLPWSREI